MRTRHYISSHRQFIMHVITKRYEQQQVLGAICEQLGRNEATVIQIVQQRKHLKTVKAA